MFRHVDIVYHYELSESDEHNLLMTRVSNTSNNTTNDILLRQPLPSSEENRMQEEALV